MEYNKQLFDLYNHHWEALVPSVNELSTDEKPAHPLLLQLPNEEEYRAADVKVMFVGRETYGWHDKFGSCSITSLQEAYSHFIMNISSENSPFWTFIKKWSHSLKTANSGTSLSMIWNNIHKLGLPGDAGAPTSAIRDIAFKDFNVFEKELTILQPNIVVFFTGYSYDEVLQTYLPGVEFLSIEGKAKKQVALCSHSSLPSTSIRTYHPKHLNMLSPEKHEFHRETPKEVLLNQWSVVAN